MASRSTHDQLMRKPITIEHHALVKYIQNDEQSLIKIINILTNFGVLRARKN